ncbi:hypothetical protein M0R04_14500 [Candidatus Dojkabacteria bacterium]|jgi:hypothetical protein|nr:hypothetical protein [Candidatus Dojkabacteria bacterium]
MKAQNINQTSAEKTAGYDYCKYCNSNHVSFSAVYGIFCKDCKKPQFPATHEEAVNNRLVMKTLFYED